ncbi:DNA replication regulator SLD3-domain-containing protein [Xylariaceae sp. FL0016]|nr:DNA replication regulator SLD3-domain-containing protein [Xylariaceae sp. FL0016]
MSSKSHSPDASRLSSGILTPSADTRLNYGSQSRKRKHDGSYAMQDLLKLSIVVKPHPPNLSVKPRTLQPLMLLSREHLQLSYLDLHAPYGSFQLSQFFQSNIKILELEGRMGHQAIVLIARLETDKTVYTIERQNNGLYCLCKLGSWVNLENLAQVATVSCTQLIQQNSEASTDPVQPHALATAVQHHEQKKRRLAIEAFQSVVKKLTRSRSISAVSQSLDTPALSTPIESSTKAVSRRDSSAQDIPDAHASNPQIESQARAQPSINDQVTLPLQKDESLTVPTADDIFDNIRAQYFDALYHSMGSLAYFAKGPLSRARAAFHLDCDSTLEMNDLIEFLKGLVLSTVQIDKKYRETVPDILAKMKITFQDSDAEQGNVKLKKRKSKKMKLGKSGLYPNEDEHIRKWWTVHKPQPKDDETMANVDPQESKLQVSLLQSRETQLQMIIIMEILALEPLRTPEESNESQLPGLPTVEQSHEPVKETPARKRNKHNLPFLLEIHADRLCIWQDTALDGVTSLEDSQPHSNDETQKSLRSTSDPLRDFCVDVIVPFFSARLPDQCDSINRKLGGPVLMSPPKSKPKKHDSAVKPRAKPGAAAKRPVPARSSSSRTLDRVLSKESERNRRSISRGPSSMIALMRSASTPTIPMIKREASETSSLSGVPRVDSAASHEASLPSGSGSTKRRSGVDKATKDALVKAQLQDAISGLRKPNREVIGKAMAEAAETRATASLSQLKKSRKPTQHTRIHNIVKATPVGNRFRDALARPTERGMGRVSDLGPVIENHVPSSSSLVPSSAPRKRNRDAAFAEEDLPRLPDFETSRAIEATPARPSAPSRIFLSAAGPDEGIVFASSPVAARKHSQLTSVPGTSRTMLFGHRDSGIGMPSSPGGFELAETPMKPRYGAMVGSLDGFVTVTPAKKRVVDIDSTVASGAGNAMDELGLLEIGNDKVPGKKLSIFERLGWDDDYDDLG